MPPISPNLNVKSKSFTLNSTLFENIRYPSNLPASNLLSPYDMKLVQ